MNIIIAGAGEVGGHAAEVLSEAGHNVTVIDLDAGRLGLLDDSLDVRTLVGHCAHVEILQEAGCEDAEWLIAATQIDEINLLTAFLAEAIGVRKTIVRVHHTANFALRGTTVASRLGIDELLCPEHLTSLEIARSLRNPGSVALEEFGRGQLLMQRLSVTKGAPAVGRKLSELSLPASARLATVEQGANASIAEADTLIEEGDFVTVVSEIKAFEFVRKLFNKGKEKRHLVAVMGETMTAVWLCRALKSRVFSVRLFVNHHDRAVRLSEKLPHVTVLEADPTESSVFTDEHIEKVDAFIAATEDDEHNILACAEAKSKGVARAMAVVQRSKYLHLLPHVGIDQAFSPRAVAVKAIQSLIDPGSVRSLATFAQNSAEVYLVRPSSKAKILGRALRNLDLPPRCVVAALRHGADVRVPGADDQLEEGDHVLVIGPCGIEAHLKKLLST